jgi:hypothetical protein
MSSSQRAIQYLQGKIALLSLEIEDDQTERMRVFRLTQKKEDELKRLQDLLREALLYQGVKRETRSSRISR